VSKDARLPISPDWSGSLGLEFRPDMRLLDANPFARFDYSYTGASVNSLEGIESVVSGNAPQTQDSYTTGDLRFGLESESWSASLYVNNVWNEYAELFFSNRWGNAEPIGGWHGGQRVSVLAPRTIGLQLKFNF